MPTYTFTCTDAIDEGCRISGEVVDLILRMDERDKIYWCSNCNGKLTRVLTTAQVTYTSEASRNEHRGII